MMTQSVSVACGAAVTTVTRLEHDANVVNLVGSGIRVLITHSVASLFIRGCMMC